MSPSSRMAAGGILLASLFLAPLARAEVSRSEANRLAVDVLTLRIGGDVRGVLLERTDSELQLAVRREWLADRQPEILRVLPANSSGAGNYNDLIDRIDAWLADLQGETTPPPYSPQPSQNSGENAALQEVLRAERDTYREYADDPLKLPPGDGDPKARRRAYADLANRLDFWLSELNGNTDTANETDSKRTSENREELIRILKSERETFALLADESQANTEPEFVRVKLSRADVSSIYVQSEARRQLTVAALQNDIENVESTIVPELQKKLSALGIDWKKKTWSAHTLIDEPTPQSEREWAARKAIYEYQFLRRLDFQGTGNMIVQTGDDAPAPDMAELLQGVLNQQTSLALGDLLDEPIFTGLDFGGLAGKRNRGDWMKKAIRIAEDHDVRGFRVTRMTPDLQRRQTIVEDRFVAQMPDGTWETIWKLQETKSARDTNRSDIDRIRQDPQLEQVLGLVEGMGLGGGNLDLALQFGAATMNAQQATDDEFYKFRDRYSQRLDGPPLSWK